MDAPPGVPVEKGFGLRVVRALYGSRQGAQRLDAMKHATFNNMGFTRMKAETSIYYTLPPSRFGFSVVGTVSDDFAIVAKTPAISAEIKKGLSAVWKVTDKGPIKWMLNMRIRRDRPKGIMKIEQSAYVEQKLRQYGLDKLPPKKLPMAPTKDFSAAQ